MKKIILRILFSLSSFFGFFIFLFVDKNLFIDLTTNNYLIFLIIFTIVVIITYVFTKLVLLACDKWSEKADTLIVKQIKPAEVFFLPVYIGLFVIALELRHLNCIEKYFFTFFLFVFWVFLENISYFNPFFLFFGYRFYEVISENKLKLMVITKRKDLKKINKFNSLIRINNFTFLEYDTSELPTD